MTLRRNGLQFHIPLVIWNTSSENQNRITKCGYFGQKLEAHWLNRGRMRRGEGKMIMWTCLNACKIFAGQICNPLPFITYPAPAPSPPLITHPRVTAIIYPQILIILLLLLSSAWPALYFCSTFHSDQNIYNAQPASSRASAAPAARVEGKH